MTAAPDMPKRLPLIVRLIPLFTVVGALAFLYRYLDDLARHRSGMLPARLLEESTGVYTALVIVPIVVAISRRVPWTRERWPRAALAHLGGAILFTVLHTTLMSLSRAVISPLVGMGTYDDGGLLWR